ncbi:hypothetical protein KIPB_011498, partial [Kipferlia bialata]
IEEALIQGCDTLPVDVDNPTPAESLEVDTCNVIMLQNESAVLQLLGKGYPTDVICEMVGECSE